MSENLFHPKAAGRSRESDGPGANMQSQGSNFGRSITAPLLGYYHHSRRALSSNSSPSGSFHSRLWFSWVSPLMDLGASRQLGPTDLLELDPHLEPAACGDKLWGYWTGEMQRNPKSPSLLRVIARAYRRPYLWMGLIKLLNDALNFSGPILLKLLVEWLAKRSRDTPPVPAPSTLGAVADTDDILDWLWMLVLWCWNLVGPSGPLFGFTCAALLGFTSICKALLNSHYNWRLGRLSCQLRAGLVSCLYRKALLVHPGACNYLTTATTKLTQADGGKVEINSKAEKAGKVPQADRLRSGVLAPNTPRPPPPAASVEVLNLMSVDAGRVVNILVSVHELWSLPLQIAVALMLLYTQVRYAFVAGLAVSVLLIPINHWVAVRIQTASMDMMTHKDERVRVTTEALSGIRTLKMLAWENMFLRKIDETRTKELKSLAVRKYLDALCVYFWAATQLLFSVLTFSLVIFLGMPLTPGVVFTSLALFQVLIAPLNAFPWVLNGVVEACVSIRRVQGYLLMQECSQQTLHAYTPPPALLDSYGGWSGTRASHSGGITIPPRPKQLSQLTDSVEACAGSVYSTQVVPSLSSSATSAYTIVERLASQSQSMLPLPAMQLDRPSADRGLLNAFPECAVLVSDASFTWQMGAAPILSNVNLSIPARALTVIVGEVGAGKSSLLSALLGELDPIQGWCEVPQSWCVGYVPQSPWLMEGTVRENILLGQPFHAPLYQQVMDACALTYDLAQLRGGDAANVGGRGSNLSGGQRARLALARALYCDCDMYLLDDVLASVDNESADHIVSAALLGPLLRNKTVIMITKNDRCIDAADQVIKLNQGKVCFVGDPKAYRCMEDETLNPKTIKHPKMDTMRSSSNNSISSVDGQPASTKGSGGLSLLTTAIPLDRDLSLASLLSGGGLSPMAAPSLPSASFDPTPTPQPPKLLLGRTSPASKGAQGRGGHRHHRSGSGGAMPKPRGPPEADPPGWGGGPGEEFYESRESGHVKMRVYSSYARAIGPAMTWMVLLSLVLMQATKNGNDLWLSYWVAGNQKQPSGLPAPPGIGHSPLYPGSEDRPFGQDEHCPTCHFFPHSFHLPSTLSWASSPLLTWGSTEEQSSNSNSSSNSSNNRNSSNNSSSWWKTTASYHRLATWHATSAAFVPAPWMYRVHASNPTAAGWSGLPAWTMALATAPPGQPPPSRPPSAALDGGPLLQGQERPQDSYGQPLLGGKGRPQDSYGLPLPEHLRVLEREGEGQVGVERELESARVAQPTQSPRPPKSPRPPTQHFTDDYGDYPDKPSHPPQPPKHPRPPKSPRPPKAPPPVSSPPLPKPAHRPSPPAPPGGGGGGRDDVNYFLTGFFTLAALNGLFTLARAFSFASAGLHAARSTHSKLLTSVLGSPMRFFDITPAGRVLNRFSSDVSKIDDTLPFVLNIMLAQSVSLLGLLTVVCFVSPMLMLFLLPMFFVYRRLQLYYRHTAREVRRLDSVSLSPVYSAFGEAVEAAPSIRAFKAQAYFLNRQNVLLTAYQRAAISGVASGTWLGVRLQLLASSLVTAVAVCAVLSHEGYLPGGGSNLSASLVGLSLAYALPLIGVLDGLLTSSAETEQEMVAVERVLEYTHLPQESNVLPPIPITAEVSQQVPSRGLMGGALMGSSPPKMMGAYTGRGHPSERLGAVTMKALGMREESPLRARLLGQKRMSSELLVPRSMSRSASPLNMRGRDTSSGGGARPRSSSGGADKDSSSHGRPSNPPILELREVFMRYLPSSPWALAGISLKVMAHEKLGVVGRTGAGKSSLCAVLLRLAEIDSGCVLLRGTDVRTIPLPRLRSSYGVVPQSPFIFRGTIRENLDPGCRSTLAQCAAALRSVRLWGPLSSWARERMSDAEQETSMTLFHETSDASPPLPPPSGKLRAKPPAEQGAQSASRLKPEKGRATAWQGAEAAKGMEASESSGLISLHELMRIKQQEQRSRRLLNQAEPTDVEEALSAGSFTQAGSFPFGLATSHWPSMEGLRSTLLMGGGQDIEYDTPRCDGSSSRAGTHKVGLYSTPTETQDLLRGLGGSTTPKEGGLEEMPLAEMNLVEAVMELPLGGGPNSVGLSTGQLQLLCVGRMLLQRKDLVLLDEATANVDGTTATLMQQVLAEQMQNCTVLQITHNLSTILSYDRLVVIESGAVTEVGAPMDLLQKYGGKFASLHAAASAGRDFYT